MDISGNTQKVREPMKSVFEKIIEKLEKLADELYKAYCIGFNSDDRAEYDAYINAIEIVKQEAEQYNNGWIPVSEKLPEESINSVIGWDEYRERCCFVQYIGGRFVLGDDTEPVKITHWMYLPYRPKGE